MYIDLSVSLSLMAIMLPLCIAAMAVLGERCITPLLRLFSAFRFWRYQTLSPVSILVC